MLPKTSKYPRERSNVASNAHSHNARLSVNRSGLFANSPWLTANGPWLAVGLFILGAMAVLYANESPQEQLAASQAQRVVSATGGLTEIVYMLGAQSQLVAVDSTSTFPEAAQQLPNIGYMRAISAEGIIAMQPSVMLATDDVGPPPVMQLIASAGVNIAMINSDDTVAGLTARIRQIGALLGKTAESTQAIKKIESAHSALVQRRARVQERFAAPRVLFVLSHAGHSPMSAGQSTAADAMIRLAGGVNVAGNFEGYKPVSKEAVIDMQPDIILTTTRGIEKLGGEKALLKTLGVAELDVAKHWRVVAMDAGYLLNFGPRVITAAQEVLQAFYPLSDIPPFAHSAVQ